MFFSALLSAVISSTVAAVRETYRPARGRSTPLSVLARLVLEFGDQPLGAPADGAGKMQVRRGRAAARQHEGAQRLQRRVEAIDLGFQPLHLLVGHREPRPTGPF